MSEDPSNALAAKLSTQRNKYTDLTTRLNMVNAAREATNLAQQIDKLPTAISDVRSKGYVFRAYLENKAQVLAQQVADVRQKIDAFTHNLDIQAMRNDLMRAERMLKDAEASDVSGQEQFVYLIDEVLDRVENKLKDADHPIQALVDTLERDYRQTQNQVSEINWFIEQRDEASFDFNPGESLFLVAKGEWVATGKGKDDPDGMLFLTDQRLVFEQKEKVGKKLGLFGGKKVQEIEWEIPLGSVENVQSENKGLFGGKDMLHFTLGSDARYPKITVEVKGSANCKFWAKQIMRMASGEANDERAISADAEDTQSNPDAPAACHICGGTLPVIAAGATSVTCIYCGAVIAL